MTSDSPTGNASTDDAAAEVASESVSDEFDLCVIGAGPAGISAAVTAAELKARVLLLDEQPMAGGQIYRQLAAVDSNVGEVLGADYLRGKVLLDRLSHSNLEHVVNACVWRVDPEGLVVFSVGPQSRTVRARHVIIATGALERPVPIPGWHLPGVMGVGAGQVLLKGQGIVPEKTVLAGSGPLLYLYASQLIRAGAPPAALLETQSGKQWVFAARHALSFLRNPQLLLKGLRLLYEIRRAKVPRYRAVSEMRVLGDDRVTGISFKFKRALTEPVVLEASTVLLHQGVVPNVQISRSLRLEHQWNPMQQCFLPVTDELCFTSQANISITGDGGGIIGADGAENAGELAALGALGRLNLVNATDTDQRVRGLQRRLARVRKSRAFLEALYQTPGAMLVPDDDVVVCRCERVSAGTVRQAVNAGCVGPNQAKAFHRCGMGPCQGRYCGLTVTTIIADATGQSESDTGYYSIRSPLKPISLEELASLDTGQHEPVH